MPTIESVQVQIEALGQVGTFGTKKEIAHLPEILHDDEKILALTSGFLNGNTWLITLTQSRIIFLDKGMLYGLKQVETPLDKINSVEHKTGLIFGEFAIWDGASKMIIKNIQKDQVVPFANTLKNALDEYKRSHMAAGSTPSQGSGDDVVS